MEKYSKTTSLHPLLLYEENLFKLEEILVQGLQIKEKEDLEVMIGKEDAELIETSFKNLFSQQLPSNTDVLSVTAWNRHDNNDDYVSIRLGNSLPHYYLSSNDDTWFYGMNTKLERYFSKLKPWYSFLRSSFSWVGPSLIVLSLTGQVYGILTGSIWLTILSFLSMILSTVIVKLGIDHKIFPQTRIFLIPKPKKKISTELIIAIFELLISVATLAGIIIPIITTDQ
ncbi:hypothetical protein KQH50_03250 [bacterium]|nr:hypothetical protein [bacterium]